MLVFIVESFQGFRLPEPAGPTKSLQELYCRLAWGIQPVNQLAPNPSFLLLSCSRPIISPHRFGNAVRQGID